MSWKDYRYPLSWRRRKHRKIEKERKNYISFSFEIRDRRTNKTDSDSKSTRNETMNTWNMLNLILRLNSWKKLIELCVFSISLTPSKTIHGFIALLKFVFGCLKRLSSCSHYPFCICYIFICNRRNINISENNIS